MSFSEILFLAALALIVIGPKQLPEVARAIGRFVNEMKRSSSALTAELKRDTKIDIPDLADMAGKRLMDNKNEHATTAATPTNEKQNLNGDSQGKKEQS